MKYYDYSRGLKAPYQIQIIRSPRGKVLWVFSQPIGLSYFVTFICLFLLIFMIGKVVTFPIFFGINVNLIVLFYLPHRLARWYAETEIDGKKGIIYLKDAVSYIREFVLDNRSMYRFERLSEEKEYRFKR